MIVDFLAMSNMLIKHTDQLNKKENKWKCPNIWIRNESCTKNLKLIYIYIHICSFFWLFLPFFLCLFVCLIFSLSLSLSWLLLLFVKSSIFHLPTMQKKATRIRFFGRSSFNIYGTVWSTVRHVCMIVRCLLYEKCVQSMRMCW